jgi:hypothetical protein
VYDFGCTLLVDETAICNEAIANVNGKNVRRQYLVGSLTGAVSSQKVTEEYIKVI